jgi:hypothetical protein
MHTHHLVKTTLARTKLKFSFDFTTGCVTVGTGRTQAAYPSVKGAAASTPSAIKRKTTCRAPHICTNLPSLDCTRETIAHSFFAGLRLQAQPKPAHKARATRQRQCTRRAIWAHSAQPAFFLGPFLPLRQDPLCDTPLSIMGAKLAPMQRVRIC